MPYCSTRDNSDDAGHVLSRENSKLTLSETTVHKVNGRPRYTYQKRGNFWVRVSIND